MNQRETAHTHERFEEQLVSYIYQEMSPEESRGFEQHAGTCPTCARDLDEFGAVRGSLGEWEILDVPRVSLHLQPTLGQSLRQLFRVMPVWVKAASCAAALLLLMALVNLRMTIGGGSGFELRTGLRPPAALPAPHPAPGMNAEQVRMLVDAAVQAERAHRRTEMQAELTALAARMSADHQRQLTHLGENVRREQRRGLETVWNEMDRRSRPTFASLFLESDSGTND